VSEDQSPTVLPAEVVAAIGAIAPEMHHTDKRARYRAILDAHPASFDAIVRTAQDRDGIVIEYAQNTTKDEPLE
jgi:hypothetical protein